MLPFISRNRDFLAAALVVISLVALMATTTRHRDAIAVAEQWFLDLLTPFFRATSETVTRARTWYTEVSQLRRLRAENDELRRAADSVASLQSEISELQAENTRLREMLGFSAQSAYPLVAAKIVARNPDNWFAIVVINRGSADGVAKDMPVVTPRGLVGRVSKVGLRSSTVMLLGDPDSGVGALVQRSRDTGVVLGAAGPNPILRMKLFSRDASVEAGDTVITSGLGGVFPAGLLVGLVNKVSTDQFGLLKVAEITPAADLARLAEVFVITGWQAAMK